MPLPMIGELSYNGVQFDSASTVRIRSQNVKDPAGRTTTSLQISLDVDGWLAPITNEADVAALRVALSKQGAPLIYTGNGFPLSVNVPGGLTDVNFGPSPEILEFEPKGMGNAAKIKWSVTTWIPACNTTDGTFGGLQEFNYQVSWSRKPNGYTTRTISGHFKIPLGWTSGGTSSRTVRDHADNYRESIEGKFEIPAACRRSTNWTLLPDKATETFTITDEEVESENPLPLGVTNIQADHRIAWGLRQGGRVQNRINATITMAAGYDAGAAHRVFRNLCDRRLGEALRIAKASGGVLLIETMDANESLFGKSHSFSIGYRITTKLPDSQSNEKDSTYIVLGERFLTLSAFNGPVASNSWDAWMASMTGNGQYAGPFSPRGTGSDALTRWGGDRIVDLCDGAGTPLAFTRPDGYRPTFNSGTPGVWAAERPRPEASWLSYKHEWSRWGRAKDVAQVHVLSKISGADQDKPPITITRKSTGSIVNDFSGELKFDDTKLLRYIKQGGGDMWLVKGSIERCLYKLPNIPSSIKLADQKATLQLIDGYLESKQNTTPLGLKVNSGSFAALYVANKTLATPPPDFSYP